MLEVPAALKAEHEKLHADLAAATEHANKLMEQKLGKGYVEATAA